MGTPEISVVVPSYGCLGCLDELCERLDTVLKSLQKSYEILIVDDRSPDNSWPLTESLAQRYEAVRGIRLSRNFGQQLAITAGLEKARGEYVIVMDCDLQDPPERIPDLLAEIQKGYDLVLARRTERTHSVFRQVSAKIYFKILHFLTGDVPDGSYGTFSILSRKVVDAFLRFGERERHYLFILRWLGFRCGTIEYAHGDRFAGSSSYNVLGLIKHALGGIFFQTSIFLTWIIYIGLSFTAISFAGGCFFIYRHLVSTSLPGWTSLFVAILFATGLVLASVGAVGLYVARIFEMTKGRPIYIVDRECGCGESHPDPTMNSAN
ncbi:glycosyltransferase family 2 protein [Cupriavidus pauculus]|uniref:Glycosyltransferase n=1 Tax=Cupriavidus pauculus TaxID=82633 RepID=A0A2N5CH18_9BURK|nr:glycosyltransferase family 2 protein [Cupriavidus pauculus]PLQ01529.1 glycosyltransferase [Cupriavidus pauculus]